MEPDYFDRIKYLPQLLSCTRPATQPLRIVQTSQASAEDFLNGFEARRQEREDNERSAIHKLVSSRQFLRDLNIAEINREISGLRFLILNFAPGSPLEWKERLYEKVSSLKKDRRMERVTCWRDVHSGALRSSLNVSFQKNNHLTFVKNGLQ